MPHKGLLAGVQAQKADIIKICIPSFQWSYKYWSDIAFFYV